MNGSLQLFEYPHDIVRLSCEKCGRSGQYRKQKLIEPVEGLDQSQKSEVAGRYARYRWNVLVP